MSELMLPEDLVHDDQVHGATKVEVFIQAGEAALADAKTSLRHFFFDQAGVPSDGSIGDALATLARQPVKSVPAAILLLRSLAVQDLIPENNHANQIVRSTVELCEGAVPDLIDFLKVDRKAQNYEKFAIISTCHSKIEDILEPVRQKYGDLDALIAGRKEVLGALNHGLVRRYCDPFRLKEVRSAVEVVYGKLKKVAELEATLLSDVEDCERCIDGARVDLSDSPTFLTRHFLLPFLAEARTILGDFLRGERQRFETKILWGAATSELQKRYPLHEPERVMQITIPLRNGGPGLATDVRASVTSESTDVVVSGEAVILGNVLPGDFTLTVDAMVIAPCSAFKCLIGVEWGEIGSVSRESDVFEFEIIAQANNIDWQALEYSAPYSLGPAIHDQFYGRIDRIKRLAARLLRRPMESFYITGQKRVGKTSLALAAARYAADVNIDGLLYVHDILWGEIAHADPSESLKQLGESIEEFIISKLPPEARPERGNYDGSLSALVKLSAFAKRISPQLRFVLVIDEFDDIHQELFLQGNLAETFFANLRAISRSDNICVVLVGGENMPFVMDRQGQKLNNFSRENLSYFSRENEWADFQLMVRSPTAGTLNWHDDAIAEIYNFTRGNPYFAKIICRDVFAAAVAGRDADVTDNEVRRAGETAVSGLGTNAFAHLWQDGIPKALAEREPDILRRMRVLVALARCLRRGLPATPSNIADNRGSSALLESEIPAVLNDFQRREVLREESGTYAINLPIFNAWLVDVGVAQLISDSLNEELANAALTEENIAVVRADEVVALADRWPTYKGRHVGTDEIRRWYQQVDNPRDQRLLFELLKRTRVFSEAHVRERLKAAHAFVRPSLPHFVIRKRGDRRSDVIITFVDGEGKSGAGYASLYAEENAISAECVIGPADFAARYLRHEQKHGPVTTIVIIDDIAATGKSVSNNIREFISTNEHVLNGLKLKLITLVATASAQASIDNLLSDIDADVEFRTCEVLSDDSYAFPDDGAGWRSKDECERARALCINLGSKIYKQNPLGFGGLGLLVVFPTTVPNNSLPILHSHARTGGGGWKPLFERVVN